MDIGNLASAYNDISSAASDKSASKLENRLGTDYSKATDTELMEACKEFEAYFLEQVFKEMMKTVPKEESSDANSTLTDYYQDEMIRNLAGTSTEQNGLGLAQTLYEQMRRNYGMDGSAADAGGAAGAGGV